MSLGLIGKKIGMTQLFNDDGTRIPVTVIEAGPCVVTQKKSAETDGYHAVQIGYDPVPMHKTTKPQQGHFKAAGKGSFRLVKEFRSKDAIDGYDVGAELKSDFFEIGDKVEISGRTKGRGFQGVIKRHGHKGGRETHGSMFHRAPGSMGAGTFPGKVRKGRKLPGHMGDVRITISNLEVMATDPEKNLLIVRGSVPGGRNSLLFIKKK